jgi:hypothetical protein
MTAGAPHKTVSVRIDPATGSAFRDIYCIAVAGAVTTIIFSFATYRYQILNPWSDFSIHFQYAARIKNDISQINGAHFLFHVILNAVTGVFRISNETATTLCLGLVFGGMAWLIAREMGRVAPQLPPVLRVVATIGVLLASHVFLQSMFTPNFIRGYVVPLSYSSQTQQLSKLLALAVLFLYAHSVLDESQRSLPRTIILLGIACILSSLAKPSFAIAFLPAAGLVALWHLRAGEWRRVAIFVAGIAIPLTLVLGQQFFWTYLYPSSADSPSIIFAPFEAASNDPATLMLRLPGSLLFPGVVLALALYLRGTTPRLWFAWLLLLIGLAISFLLAEGGSRLKHGNFFWTGQTVMFLLYVESLLCLVALKPRQAWPGWVAFVPHVLCGFVHYGAVTLYRINDWF